MAPFSLIATVESGELADDIRELFDDLTRSLGTDPSTYPGQCRPLIDVFETDETVALVVDVCGVPPAALRVAFRDGVVIVAGEKAPGSTTPDMTFHLVERDFGRFARAIRLAGAFDVARARATLQSGELVIVLPKLVERRRRMHRIPVDSPATPSA